MYMELLAAKLLHFVEAIPRRAPQNWLEDFNRGELFLLNYLFSSEGAVRPSSLSEAMQTSTARVAAALNSLERKGLIKREFDDFDHRRKLVSLTSDGSDYIESHRQKALQKTIRLLEELGENDATEYLRITQRMAKISQNLEFDN